VSCVWEKKSMYKQQGALTAHLLASGVPGSTFSGHFSQFHGMGPGQPRLPAYEGRTPSR